MSNVDITEEPSTSNCNSENRPDLKTELNLARYRSLLISECGVKITTSENYIKRLQNLRKELNYISETDWMFESLDKRPSQ